MIYNKKVINIIKSVNIYIEDYINFDYKYILSKINSDNILENYYISKYKKLNKANKDCINYLKSFSNIFNGNNNNYVFLNSDNYDNKIFNIIFDMNNFFINLENITNQTFTLEECDENNNCFFHKKEISLNYSKYNYNIVKLRTGIYYTK
jgi:hypothetical protein